MEGPKVISPAEALAAVAELREAAGDDWPTAPNRKKAEAVPASLFDEATQ